MNGWIKRKTICDVYLERPGRVFTLILRARALVTHTLVLLTKQIKKNALRSTQLHSKKITNLSQI